MNKISYQIFLKHNLQQTSWRYPKGLIIKLLIKHRSVIVEVVNKLKFALITVAFLQQTPYFISLCLY